ncbi:hypothetical protein ETAA8_44870 [Anatilimnocola aggregata]|uniref:LssY-like C-terminal domain-containing protein n=1 Tax=Anatilimnocola aggregata TaxID=2528021 RepID=A0A517YGN6_9BACT|nr:LssY C-terminal domain-containing protein [Anatilimnocola aggregata]QDU29378.1 hypothetical protein ETAA8_44870 [Anatilimnocola aggregata]
MNEVPATSESAAPVSPKNSRSEWKTAVLVFLGIVATYFLVAYVVMPLVWKRYAHRHPGLDNTPGMTVAADGHLGDPINVALVSAEADLKPVMEAAGWFPADPLGVRADLKIAADTVLSREYRAAPVSNLFLYGRKEDFAFEKPVGNNPRQRHHVRFWKSAQLDDQNRPLWVGSAAYDSHVELSRTTGQITHHISPDVDAERDLLFGDLQQTGRLVDVQLIADFHKTKSGKNGGGDPWHTDGALMQGTIRPATSP